MIFLTVSIFKIKSTLLNDSLYKKVYSLFLLTHNKQITLNFYVSIDICVNEYINDILGFDPFFLKFLNQYN